MKPETVIATIAADLRRLVQAIDATPPGESAARSLLEAIDLIAGTARRSIVALLDRRPPQEGTQP